MQNMKRNLFFFAAVLAAAPLLKAATPTPPPAPAQTPAQQGSKAEVVFVSPENFTDVRDSYTGTDRGREDILDQLREYMLDEAKRFIPQGDRLYISVTDVDLAGDYEPWRGPQWDDVRIVKDIYPPKINLSFRVTDSSGRVIKEGTRELRDLAFLMNLSMQFREDRLRHEKTMLDDWFRSEFRDLPKS